MTPVIPPLASQRDVDAEMDHLTRSYAGSGLVETQPRLDYPPYRSSLLRHPTKDLHHGGPRGRRAVVAGLRPPRRRTRSRPTSPSSTAASRSASDSVVTGRVLDGDGRPVRRQLVEVWQANAGGRYIHQRDQHPAAIDPNFTGLGRCLTDDDGVYAFTTIKPGPYPWRNHHNAWRPAHIHFSLFGTEFTQRMVTQMYFPGDPLFALDPIYQSILDPRARERLVATYDHDVTQHEWGTGYRWDIVLTGSHRTPLEQDTGDPA